jgi:outer membrane protein assembly factor BamD (BamD/ComL family)
LREKRWADAATSYRAIVSTYPSSPEAHTVLVPLANLEVDRLGQAAAGLKHLDAYLATGGPLSPEAELGKIRAFRSLGRSSDEARAIDAFLAAHPKSLDADTLKQRRSELGQ